MLVSCCSLVSFARIRLHFAKSKLEIKMTQFKLLSYLRSLVNCVYFFLIYETGLIEQNFDGEANWSVFVIQQPGNTVSVVINMRLL